MNSPIRYLNTDLDLVSNSDLTGLASSFEARGFDSSPVRRGEDGLWYATVQRLVEENEVPEQTISVMLEAVESLDKGSRAAWSGCAIREFNIGYDCGTEPWAFNDGLSNKLLERIAAVGASVRITLYPPEEYARFSSISGPAAVAGDQTVIEIDVAEVTSREDLHDLLARRLGFPNYYGRNWDAFWDCVRDPAQSKMPTRLRIIGWLSLREKLPRDARLMRQCLSDLPVERPEMTIEWVASLK